MYSRLEHFWNCSLFAFVGCLSQRHISLRGYNPVVKCAFGSNNLRKQTANNSKSALVGSTCTKPRQDGMPPAAKAHSTNGVPITPVNRRSVDGISEFWYASHRSSLHFQYSAAVATALETGFQLPIRARGTFCWWENTGVAQL